MVPAPPESMECESESDNEKSIIFTLLPLFVTSMLLGFKSLCITCLR